MKKLMLFLLTCHLSLVTCHSFPQDQHLIDSLQTRLKTAKQDTTRANILYELCWAYIDNTPDKAMEYARQTLSLSEQIGYKKGMGNAYNGMGNIKFDKGEYMPALELYQKALKIRTEICDKKGLEGSYLNLGRTYYYQGNYPEALKNYFASLKIAEEIGDKEGVATSHNSIGFIYLNQGNYSEALKYHSTALKIQEEIGDKSGIAYSYYSIGIIYKYQGNYPAALKNYFAALKIREKIGSKQGIAECYASIGIIYYDQGNQSEALKNYSAALKICEEIKDKQGIAACYLNIGNINTDQGNYPEALKKYNAALNIFRETGVTKNNAYVYANIGYINFKQGNDPEALNNYFAALKISEEIGDKYAIASTSLDVGQVYIKQKKFREAAQFVNKGLALAKEMGNLQKLSDVYLTLAELDSAQGNCVKSMEHYKLHIAMRDSIYGQEKTKKMVQIEADKKEELAKAEQEKKDALTQKELQKQKLVRNGFIGGTTIFLLLTFAIFLGFRRAAAARKKSDELLLNILPAEVAMELKTTGHCQAKTFSMVTVMFMDFKDFTKVSENVSAELLVDEINTCFSAFDGIIQKYKVEKIKTIGDAYICAGGLPVLNQTHARDILNAAIEIRDFMIARKREKDLKEEFAFEMRIGVHTGPVVAGIVGVKKFQYDIWGDTVNLAARMEQNSEAGKINISGSTYKLVKDKFNCTYRGKIEAKNKGEVEMYFVERIA